MFLNLLNEKGLLIPSSETKCPEMRVFLLIIIGWGESGKTILMKLCCLQSLYIVNSLSCCCMLFGQVRLTVFFRALSKYLSGKDGSAPGNELQNLLLYVPCSGDVGQVVVRVVRR